MIKRDSHGIIVQHNVDYPDYLDGGDSAARTGIMALCGSEQDQYNLSYFSDYTFKLVRHPHQNQWKDSSKTSRDQLIQWAAGVSRCPTKMCVIVCIRYSESWFINKDFLSPDVLLYLYKCISRKAPMWLKITGYPMMFLSLLWSCFIVPNSEQNKIFCMCAVMGDWWLEKLVAWHPNLACNMMIYWCGYPWRDQVEIYNAICAYIQKRISV